MYCPNCGKEQNESNKFCENCGINLGSKTIDLNKEDTQEINIPNNYYNNDNQYYDNGNYDDYHRQSNKNKPYVFALVACVVIIFLLSGAIITYFVVNNASKNAVETAMNNASSQSTASSSSSTDNSSKSSSDSSNSNKVSNSTNSDQTTADENKTPPAPPASYEPPIIPSYIYGKNNYIIPYSDRSYLTSRDISKLSNYELGIARNEIYARHGYIFQLDQFRRYFESQNWYVPRYTSEADISLNKYEKYNAEIIKAEEDSRGVKWN